MICCLTFLNLRVIADELETHEDYSKALLNFFSYDEKAPRSIKNETLSKTLMAFQINCTR